MAALTVTRVLTTGVSAVMASASSGGDTALNTKMIILKVINGGGTGRTVTVTAQRALCGEPSLHDSVTEVGAGETKYIGPFDRYTFNDADDKIAISYDNHADLTIGGLEVVSV